MSLILQINSVEQKKERRKVKKKKVEQTDEFIWSSNSMRKLLLSCEYVIDFVISNSNRNIVHIITANVQCTIVIEYDVRDKANTETI